MAQKQVINMLGGIRVNTASLTRDSTSPGEELKAVATPPSKAHSSRKPLALLYPLRPPRRSLPCRP